MRNTIWDKKIPTLLGLILITIGIGITSLLVKEGTSFISRADPSTEPQDVRITNISNSSFTVSYQTSGEVFGSINLRNEKSEDKTFFDERDKPGLIQERKIHSIMVKNLSPSTKYSFSITSGKDSFLNNDLPFTAVTAPVIGKIKPSFGFIVGKVVLANGEKVKEAIIYVSANGSQALSTIAAPDGTYALSLEGIKTENLSSYFNFSKDDNIKMLVLGDGKASHVRLFAKEVNSVPTIVLSQNYDFTISNEPSSSESAVLGNFPIFPKAKGGKNPDITAPQDNQKLADAKPLFKGTGIPNDTIKIVIESPQTIEAQVTTDSNGNWSFTPTTSLTPGQHKISIQARDGFGVLRTISKVFTIELSQAQAASPTPSPAPTSTPTPSLTPSPSKTPVAIPTPSPVQIQTPTQTPSTKGELPVVGNSAVSTGIIGIGIAILGGLLFLITRGGISL